MGRLVECDHISHPCFERERAIPQAYLDFDLEIGAGDGLTYPLAVLQSPVGNARVWMTFPFRDLELENRLLALQNALLKSGGARRKALTGDEQAVRDFGHALFAVLFREDIRSAYDVSRRMAREQGCGLRLKLRFLRPNWPRCRGSICSTSASMTTSAFPSARRSSAFWRRLSRSRHWW